MNRPHKSAQAALRAPGGRRQEATTMAYSLEYVEEERRSRGPAAAATFFLTMGWADLCRRAALLVTYVLVFRVRCAPRALRGSHLGPARPRGFMRPVLILGAFLCAPASGFAADTSDEPRAQTVDAISVEAPMQHPRLGERLGFHGRWFGIPVGYGAVEVAKEFVEISGRKAYHIKAEVHTNEVLSAFYPIHDVVDSYLDAETLQPLKFEKHQHEGNYRADEIVLFDYATKTATYESLLNKSVKKIPLPDEFQDIISAIYWFRSQAVTPNKALNLAIYTDEKIYETQILIKKPMVLELRKRGTFPCLVVEPKPHFKGLLVKRGRIWAYLTADKRRLPLFVKATTPWGAMSAVLDLDSLEASKEP